MAQCMAMGQAAGTAAAMAATGGSGEVRAVDADVVRARLRSDGALLDVPIGGPAS
jgi:hypothetical protein